MALRFYNTLTRKKEEFRPLKEGMVRMYTCGPTVYNFAHIGNLRAYVVSDLIRRYLLYKGYKLKHVMNITDVDDKTIKGSRKAGKSLNEYTEGYAKEFFKDIETLNIQKADVYPRATKHIGEMVEMVKKLLDKGYAYKGSDGIYFDISKFKDYGKFARLDLKGLKAGARVRQDSYDKEYANDFALWKFWDKDDGDVYWETEIGKGRPGWHIECSAMSSAYLGNQFDIHTGGVDLIFPHHQNEIAQSEAALGVKPWVRYWLHNEHLLVNGRKMSKSLGNFYTLRDLLAKGYDPLSIRYVLLSTHYRQKLDFSESAIEKANSTLKRLYDFMSELQVVKSRNVNTQLEKVANETRKKFEEAMDDDLNVSEALAAIFDMVTEVNKAISEKKMGRQNAQRIYGLMLEFDKVLGLKIEREESWKSMEEAPNDVKELLEKREKFRAVKDWSAADGIRNELRKLGFVVQDTEDGPRWRKE